jgi:hypothetical protein
MRKNLRELAGPALFGATFVVPGVVLALAGNEWRQGIAVYDSTLQVTR